MSRFLLDTNIPSETVRPQPEPKVAAWLASQKIETLYLSVVTCGELCKGIAILAPGKRKTELEAWYGEDLLKKFAGRILPLTQTIAERWGALEVQRQLSGRIIQVPDAQIAATALEHGLTLVTRNIRDFEGLGLTLINPWK
jgi:predicted nucleic acid-binding protein